MKVQIIGLPGAGKTTGIEGYMRDHVGPVSFIDLRKFTGTYRERAFLDAITRSKQKTIAESVCGARAEQTFIIHLDPPIQNVYERLLNRDKILDEDYLSLLSTQILPAHVTITKPEDIPGLLKLLLEG